MKKIGIGMLLFYAVIIMYIIHAVLQAGDTDNYVVTMLFQIVGICLLGCSIMGKVLFKPLKVGYYVPLIMVTVIYNVILDIFNFACLTIMPGIFFFLVNLVLLFVYSLVSVPMYVMGSNRE